MAKEIEPVVHVFHFRTSKFDYEEDFAGPAMLLTEVNQAFAFATYLQKVSEMIREGPPERNTLYFGH